MALWKIPRDWAGETAYVIAGGTSVTQADVDLLRGRNVIVINSSYERAMWAPILFFADVRWWKVHATKLKRFSGIKATTSVSATSGKGKEVLSRLVKVKPSPGAGIVMKPPYRVAVQRTGLTGGMNIAVHKGVRRIALLGADMRPSDDGNIHHHSPHPKEWKRSPNTWTSKITEMEMTIEPLRKAGIEVINCSSISVMDWWPKADVREVIAMEDAK